MLPLIIVVTVGHHSNFIGRIFACTVRTPMDTNFHDEAKCGRKDRLRPVLQSGECLYCSYSRSASLFLPLRGAHQIRMGQVLTYPLTRKEGMCYRALHNGRCLFFFFSLLRVCVRSQTLLLAFRVWTQIRHVALSSIALGGFSRIH